MHISTPSPLCSVFGAIFNVSMVLFLFTKWQFTNTVKRLKIYFYNSTLFYVHSILPLGVASMCCLLFFLFFHSPYTPLLMSQSLPSTHVLFEAPFSLVYESYESYETLL